MEAVVLVCKHMVLSFPDKVYVSIFPFSFEYAQIDICSVLPPLLVLHLLLVLPLLLIFPLLLPLPQVHHLLLVLPLLLVSPLLFLFL